MTSPVVEFLTAAERLIEHLCGVYRDKVVPTSHPDLIDISHQYKVDIITSLKSSDPSLSFDPIDDVQEHVIADMLKSELAIYPSEIIKESKVERLVLCGHLRCYGEAYAGLASVGLFMIDTLFIDVADITHHWDYARKSLHHELFHAIDYHDDIWRWLDTDWFHLNRPGFRYDRGLFKGVNEPSFKDGFVSTYAMTSVHEDKAEVYSHLIIHYREMEQRAASDEILASKIDRMKTLLHRFDSRFDDAFWSRAAERSHLANARTHSQWQKLQHASSNHAKLRKGNL